MPSAFRPKRDDGSGKREIRTAALERRLARERTANVDATDSAKALAGQHDVDLAAVANGEAGEITESVVRQAMPPTTEHVEEDPVPMAAEEPTPEPELVAKKTAKVAREKTTPQTKLT